MVAGRIISEESPDSQGKAPNNNRREQSLVRAIEKKTAVFGKDGKVR